MNYKIITPVTAEPVTLAEIKDFLRLTAITYTDSVISEETAEDYLLSSLITAAREYCEGVTGRALVEQTIEAYLDGFPCGREKWYIELPRPPLQSVTSLKYTDNTGAETTMIVNTDYIVDLDSNISRIVLPYGANWPSFTPYPINPIKVTYVAGYSDTDPIPKTIKQAMLLLIGHWYANREATGDVKGKLAYAVDTLLNMHRVRWF